MKHFTLAASISALVLAGAAHAGIGVDGTVGTQGLSANGHFQASPFITLRAGVNLLEFELQDMEYDDLSYDVDLNFSQFGGYVDFHPMMNGLTVTGGLLVGERSVDLISRPTTSVLIGDVSFNPDDVGELVGSADFGDTAYYAGLGWDSTTHGLLPVAFVIRAGLIVTDSPTIDLFNRGGTVDPIIQAELDAEIEREKAALQDDLEDFRFYPVISVGLGFGF